MKRERLKLMFYIKTDKSEYMVYNTQTIKQDCANIQIEQNKSKIILEKEIFDESIAGMCGDSFYTLVCRALDALCKYINERKEIIIQSVDCKTSSAFSQYNDFFHFYSTRL